MIIVHGRRSQSYLTIMMKSLTTNPGYCKLHREVSSNNQNIIYNMEAMAEKMQPFQYLKGCCCCYQCELT